MSKIINSVDRNGNHVTTYIDSDEEKIRTRLKEVNIASDETIKSEAANFVSWALENHHLFSDEWEQDHTKRCDSLCDVIRKKLAEMISHSDQSIKFPVFDFVKWAWEERFWFRPAR